MSVRHRDLAPFDDEDVEIWALNESQSDRFDFVKRCTRHFQLHPFWNCMRPDNQNDPHHPDWLRREHPFPIYMQDTEGEYKEIPSAKKYPLEEIEAWVQEQMPGRKDYPSLKWDVQHWQYYTNTFPYMLL